MRRRSSRQYWLRKTAACSGTGYPSWLAHRRSRRGAWRGRRRLSPRSSSEHELYPLVLAALALVARDLHLPHLARVGDVGPTVGLRIEALYLHDTNNPYPLRDEVDLGADEVGGP